MHISQLFEEENPQLTELIHVLRTQCSEFLTNPTPLYRGANDFFSDGRLFAVPTVRKDRRSLSGKHIGTNMFNMMFEETFHVPRLRNECVFVSNSGVQASKYGPVWCIFPKNGSKITANPSYKDSITVVGSAFHEFIEMSRRAIMKNESDKQLVMKWIKESDKPIVESDWFDELLNNVTPELSDVLAHSYDEVKERTMNGYQVFDISHTPTYSTQVEYMIYDCDSFIAVDIDAIRKLDGFPDDDNRAWAHLIETLK